MVDVPDIPRITDSQRAKIKTVDLDNPPSFIRVVRDLSELEEMRSPSAGKIFWIHKPHHNELEGLFGQPFPLTSQQKQQSWHLDTLKRENSDISFQRDIEPGSVSRHKGSLRSIPDPRRKRFIRSIYDITQQAAEALNALTATTHIVSQEQNYFLDLDEQGNHSGIATDIHIDSAAYRGFCALNYGNLLMPDLDNELGRSILAVQVAASTYPGYLLDKDVAIYTAPLGCHIFFHSADQNVAPPAYHAVNEMPVRPRIRRIYAETDFDL